MYVFCDLVKDFVIGVCMMLVLSVGDCIEIGVMLFGLELIFDVWLVDLVDVFGGFCVGFYVILLMIDMF